MSAAPAAPAPAVDIAAIVRDPMWFADRYDPGHDAVHFRRLSRDDHRAATFLTDEYLPADAPGVVIRRDDAIAAAPPTGPIHFIFHSAFCCSTLLARAVDVPGVAMGLKEPVLLNDLVGWKARGAAAGDLAGVLDTALTLLARPFALGEAVVVKPSNICNGIASAMLTVRPDSRALLLHAPLRTFLGSIARKSWTGRLWVRDLLVKQRHDGIQWPGMGVDDFMRLTDLQAAAIGWLAQHAIFARIAARFPDRVSTIDSETLMTDPGAAMTAPPAPWDGIDTPTASVQRFELMHHVEELAWHAGHADIVREQLDGACAPSLLMAVEGRVGNEFVQPWAPPTS